MIEITDRNHDLTVAHTCIISDLGWATATRVVTVNDVLDGHEASKLGETFREIAAGVTLLERRSIGQAVPTETVMLAVT